MLDVRSKFIALVNNDHIKKSDAIVLLCGDGFNRLAKTFSLISAGMANMVVISGGVSNPKEGSLKADLLAKKLVKMGVPMRKIRLDLLSKNTRDQAIEIMKMVKRNNWQNIILVASHYHQYRAFLTFLRAMKEENLNLNIYNAPAQNLPWFSYEKWGQRYALLDEEFEKIKKYHKFGHVASFDEAIEYQEKKEIST